MEQEIWLPIKYGNGKKEISNLGNVRNAATNRVLKSYISKQNGYRHISFYVDKKIKSKTFKIHRLVAEHFIPNPGNKRTVNHKDLNKLNNHVGNLEWNTMLENIDHYFKTGFKGKINDDDVLFIRQNIEEMGCHKIAEILGINWSYVLSVANGTYKPNVHKELIRPKQPSLPKQVLKYSIDNVLIETYNSIGEAAKSNNAKLSYIQRVLSGEHKSYKGFIYKCEGYKQVERKASTTNFDLLREKYKKEYIPRPRVLKSVEMLNVNGGFVRIFVSTKEAAEYIGTNPETFRRAIRANVKGYHKGFIWKYADAV